MKAKYNNDQKSFDKDYNRLMKYYHNPFISQPHQWTNMGDTIIKFSLYQETPNSITSTNTSANIGI